MGFEYLHDAGEVGEGAREAIDLVDHHHIDALGEDIAKQRLEGRAVEAVPTAVALVG